MSNAPLYDSKEFSSSVTLPLFLFFLSMMGRNKRGWVMTKMKCYFDI